MVPLMFVGGDDPAAGRHGSRATAGRTAAAAAARPQKMQLSCSSQQKKVQVLLLLQLSSFLFPATPWWPLRYLACPAAASNSDSYENGSHKIAEHRHAAAAIR